MAKPAKRAALYVRVSTDHQSVENQIRELRQVAERRGCTDRVRHDVEKKTPSPAQLRLRYERGSGRGLLNSGANACGACSYCREMRGWWVDDSPHFSQVGVTMHGI